MMEVAVIIPIYKTDLSDEEHLSLKLAKQHFLDKTVFIVAPKKLKNDHSFNEIVKKYKFNQHFFDDKYFKNIPGYNRLMLNIDFYKAFESFRYILIYQFDALVFSGDLSYWTSKDYDYIGAPWTIKEHNSKVLFDAMGNGGLSLRKVSKFIEVLSSKKFYYDDDKFFAMSTRAGVKNLFLVKLLHKLSKNLFGLNYLSIMKFLFRGDEDYFWAFLAKFFVEDFNLGSCTDALMFSFETEPRYCYIENNNKLPFGCHAWEKYDKAFWIDILEQQGYEI